MLSAKTATVAMWPHAKSYGFDGTNTEQAGEPHWPANLLDALEDEYTFDALIGPAYVINAEGVPAPTQPRLKQVGVKYLRVIGMDVRFDTVFVDVDGPGHERTPAWTEEQEAIWENLPWVDSMGWYLTRGGYRLVWVLPRTMTLEEYEPYRGALYSALSNYGIDADPVAWNNAYYAPFCTKRGQMLQYPFDFSNLGVIDFDPPLVADGTIFSGFSCVASSKKERKQLALDEDGRIADGGRTAALVSYAGRCRNAGMVADEIEMCLRMFYERKCAQDPPLKMLDNKIRKLSESAESWEVFSAKTLNSDAPLPTEMTDYVANCGPLDRGSSVAIASILGGMIDASTSSNCIYDRSALWSYKNHLGIWEEYDARELVKFASHLDGFPYQTEKGLSYLRLTNGQIKDTLEILYSLRMSPAYFDNPRQGVAFNNGFVDLDGIGPHDSTNRARHRLNYDYDPSKKPEMFLEFLHSCGHDDDTIATMQEALGATMFGMMPQYGKAIMMPGTGSNGKSTFLNIISAVFPSEKITSVAPHDFGNDQKVALLMDSMINVLNEMPDADLLASERIKAVITGDSITAKVVYKPAFDFRPTCGHWLAGNALSRVADTSRGFWRRWIVVPWTRTVDAEDQIPDLDDKIATKETGAIASWAVEGARRLAARKHFAPSDRCLDALEEWRNHADPLQGFLSEGTEASDDAETTFDALFQEYRRRIRMDGGTPLQKGTFRKRLVASGVEEIKTPHGEVRMKLKLVKGGKA